MQTVTVYSTPNCSRCKVTYMALDRAGVPYTPVDVSQDEGARAYVEDLGYTEAPVVVVDDDNHWSGYRPEQIARVARALASE